MSGMRFFRIVTDNIKTSAGISYINRTDLENSSLIHWTTDSAPAVFTGTRYYVFDQAIASIEVVAGVIYKAVGDGSSVTYTALTRLPSSFGTAASANTGTSEGNVPVLDANGKLNSSVIPSVAINEFLGSYADWAAAAAGVSHAPEGGDTIIVGVTQSGALMVAPPNDPEANGVYIKVGETWYKDGNTESPFRFDLIDEGDNEYHWAAVNGPDDVDMSEVFTGYKEPWEVSWNYHSTVTEQAGSAGSLYICVDPSQSTFADKFVLLRNEEGSLSTNSFIEGDGIILTKTTVGSPTITVAAKVDETANSIVVDSTSKGLKVNLASGAVKSALDAKADKTSVFLVTSTDPATLADGNYYYTSDNKFYSVSSNVKTQIVPAVSMASASVLGGIKVGSYLSIANDGTLSVNLATSSTPGVVQPDNDTITISNGVISSAGGKWTQISVSANDFDGNNHYSIAGLNEIMCIDSNGYEFMPSDIIRSTSNGGTTTIDMTGASAAERSFTIYARKVNYTTA